MKTLSKSTNKYEGKAANAYGKAYNSILYRNLYNERYEKAIVKNNIEKGKKYLEKRNIEDANYQKMVNEFKTNKELILKSKKFIEGHSDYMITYERGTAYSGYTPDGASLRVGYDKTKVRENTTKNRKRYYNKQKERNYDLTKVYTTHMYV